MPCMLRCAVLPRWGHAQGWFHSDSLPENASLATATQLQLKLGEDSVQTFEQFAGEVELEGVASWDSVEQ
jgi:hypothetical protein